MRSMTGYGRGETAKDGFKFTVELNSINRKQSDISINLPKELVELEPRIRDEINAHLSRGRINVVVAFHRSNAKAEEQVELDVALAKAYQRAIQKLQKEMKLGGSLTLDTILRAPGVLKLAEAALDAESIWPHVESALRKAITGLVKMREKEGKFLANDLAQRLSLLESGLELIRKSAPEIVTRYREQLHARVREAGLNVPLDDERLVKEVVFFADRCDISEEITRLSSHFNQCRGCLKSDEPVGRTLDFLAQEMGREINTIGSKANAAEISQQVVKMKAELEKIREQIQNIE
ncbi:MAG TPA: YicC/YloC family endoribonuclease [Verrucomicrobiae bacterium]|nr:YicC/YloC family endoribonuclease [Verrucomicrobiae bacterium]